MPHEECGHLSLSQALSPQVDKLLKSVTHGQCDARPQGYLPSHRASPPLDQYRIILVGEQLAQDCCVTARNRESNPRPSESQVQRPNHYTTTPHSSSQPLQHKSQTQRHARTNIGTTATIVMHAMRPKNEKNNTNNIRNESVPKIIINDTIHFFP